MPKLILRSGSGRRESLCSATESRFGKNRGAVARDLNSESFGFVIGLSSYSSLRVFPDSWTVLGRVYHVGSPETVSMISSSSKPAVSESHRDP